MAKVTCSECGIVFASRPSENRKFCGADCYRAHEIVHGRKNATEATVFACKICDSKFSRMPGEIRQYRKQFGANPRYCSIPCSAAGRKRDSEKDVKFHCAQCGTDVPVVRRADGTLDKRTTRRFCSTDCRSLFRRLSYQRKHPDQGISRTTARGGYIRLVIPQGLGQPSRKDVFEHRYVVEQAIGRELHPEETVHHINGDRSDNRYPENLELFSSRHGPGQRVTDKIAFAVEMIRLYPEFLSDTDRSELAGLLDHAANVSRT